MEQRLRNEELRAAWLAKKSANARARARDAARELHVTEAELLAAFVGAGATRLDNDWRALIEGMRSVGTVMCLTRNEHCVIERDGKFEDVQVSDRGGVVLGPDIDLRLFFSAWHSAFALIESVSGGDRYSIQVFDAAGVAIHKIYARETTDLAAWKQLIIARTLVDSSAALHITPASVREKQRGPRDLDAFRKGWLALQDTHDFFALLKEHSVDRLAAMRAAPEGMARPVKVDSVRTCLELAAATHLPIMIFVGNRGCIQIHTGQVSRIVPTGPWLNVLDPAHNLHLREDAIAEAWVVRKPTRDGVVTSLELYDDGGETIAMFFGERKPGRPELEAWRALTAAL